MDTDNPTLSMRFFISTFIGGLKSQLQPHDKDSQSTNTQIEQSNMHYRKNNQ